RGRQGGIGLEPMLERQRRNALARELVLFFAEEILEPIADREQRHEHEHDDHVYDKTLAQDTVAPLRPTGRRGGVRSGTFLLRPEGRRRTRTVPRPTTASHAHSATAVIISAARARRLWGAARSSAMR